MNETDGKLAGAETFFTFLVAGLMAIAILAIFLLVPNEQTMGYAQRILYVHVSVAWLGLAGCVATAVAGVVYLLKRNLLADQWAQAAAELGWLCCGLTLLTGSLWAHAAWATWWTWDPRLTTAFILWMILSGYLVVRSNIDDAHRRARVSAVLAIVGVLDVPLVVVAARWFRGMHPGSPAMEPAMRAVLLLSVLSFSAFFALLFVRRKAQLRLEGQLAVLERRADDDLLVKELRGNRWVAGVEMRGTSIEPPDAVTGGSPLVPRGSTPATQP